MDFQISLRNIDEMFGEPAADPFDPDSRYQSGIDELVGKLRLRGLDLRNQSRLVVYLPQAAITPETQPALKAAMERYSTAKIAENQQVIHEVRAISRRQTYSALALVVIIMLLAILLLYLVPGLQVISGAIYGLAMVSIWVVVWDPIYNYIYTWRPNKLDIKVYENLRAADLVVKGTS
jgi:hypothetical protein